MTAELLSKLLSLFSFAAIALIIGSCVYLAFRVFEQGDAEYALLINVVITLAILVGAVVYSWPASLYLFVPILVVVLCSLNFHRKSGGASQSVGQAFFLMMASILVTMGLALLVQFYLWPRYLTPPFAAFSTSIGFFLMLSPVPLMPILLWAYQSVRFRPGIDRHLRADELEGG